MTRHKTGHSLWRQDTGLKTQSSRYLWTTETSWCFRSAWSGKCQARRGFGSGPISCLLAALCYYVVKKLFIRMLCWVSGLAEETSETGDNQWCADTNEEKKKDWARLDGSMSIWLRERSVVCKALSTMSVSRYVNCYFFALSLEVPSYRCIASNGGRLFVSRLTHSIAPLCWLATT